MKSFIYLGLTFKPIETLPKSWFDSGLILKCCGHSLFTPANWNHTEFYKIAREHGAGEIDVFEMNNEKVLTGGESLFKYRPQ